MKYQLKPQQAELNINGITTAEGWALIYNVDSQTGEFKNASYEYLPVGVSLPAFAYLDAPKAQKDDIAIVRDVINNKWAYFADKRGQTIYNINDGSQKTVDFIGDLPADYTDKAPSGEFDSWNGEEWIEDKEKALQHRILIAKQEYDARMLEADSSIADLNEAIELERATDDQIKLYKIWREYRFDLKKIDLNKPDLINWPQVPEKPNFVS